MRTILAALALNCALAFGQFADTPPKFEAADIHSSAKVQYPFLRTAPIRNGRYEVKYATMVDLIHIAYDYDDDKVLGGPSWLEMDRFDIAAKVPPETAPDAVKLMLQSLLAERFKLVVHKEKKPLPTFAVIAGKKLLLKEAEGTEASGCKPQSQSGEGGMRIMFSGAAMGGGDGAVTTLTLGPGGTVQFACRNMTMEAFVSGLPKMFGANASLGQNPLIDDTGLMGRYNFDVHWSMGIMGPNITQSDRVSVAEALEKQLGLKLEERQVPTPVIVVDSVDRKPSENPPDTAKLLPQIVVPTEFEVASVKPSDPAGRGGSFRPMAGGRFNATGMNLHTLISQAFLAVNSEQVTGVPAWADSERFDIVAKASTDSTAPAMDREVLAPMLRALLVDRFKMTYHTEDRQASGYVLVAAKPKMKKADPASRTFCKNLQQSTLPPNTRGISCQNTTMAGLAEFVQNAAFELAGWPVLDSTGLEGGWDFTLTYTMNFGVAMRVGSEEARKSADSAPGGGPAAPADPTGGQSIFEAIEKQLGLKLDKQKRTVQVYVIDHLEQKPTEN